jgi:hypothetical protein
MKALFDKEPVLSLLVILTLAMMVITCTFVYAFDADKAIMSANVMGPLGLLFYGLAKL